MTKTEQIIRRTTAVRPMKQQLAWQPRKKNNFKITVRNGKPIRGISA